jgi:hypothetical protein
VKDLLGIDDKAFAACVVTYFMQVMGILQLPAFLGPQFSPFGLDLLNPWKDSSTWTVAGKEESLYHKQHELEKEMEESEPIVEKKRRKRNKNKVKTT